MSEQDKALAKMQGPFSPERYTEKDATAVGLPSPEGLNLLVKFSEQMIGTPFIPKGIAVGPNQAGNILAVIMTGREEGFGPMEALRSYWISPDGRLAKYADAVMAKMRRAGFKFPEQEFSATKAHLKGVRPDGDQYTSTLTIEEVPGTLRSKQIWKDWPQRMLKARVIGDVYRFLGSDLGGPTYTSEELQDLDYPDSTTAEPTEADRKRAEVIAARDDMKVSLKQKPEAAPVEVKVEPEQQPPAGPEVADEPQQAETVQYAIHRVFNTGNGGERVLPTDETPQKLEENANLRAQALANETGSAHIVIELTSTGQVTQKRRFEPPKPIKKADKKADKPTEKPVAASEPSEPTKEAPPATTDPKAVMVNRLNALASILGLPGKTAGTRFNSFFAGYFGCGLRELPKDSAAYAVAIEELEGCIGSDINEFNAGPEEAGKRRARWAKDNRNYLDGQYPKHPETVELGVTLARRWRLTPPEFKTWFESKVVSLDFTPQTDGHAFMRVMVATPNLRSGSELLTWFKGAKLPPNTLAKAVQQIEQRALKCPLEEAEEKTIDKAVKAWLLAAKEQAPETVPAEAEEAPPPEEVGGLFDEFLTS